MRLFAMSLRKMFINQAMAAKFWPNENPLGKRFSTKGPKGPFKEVIGVVQTGKYKNVVEDPTEPFFYVPIEQNYVAYRTIHVRTSVPPESLQRQIEAQVRELAPGIPISQVQTMTQALQGVNGFFLFPFRRATDCNNGATWLGAGGRGSL